MKIKLTKAKPFKEEEHTRDEKGRFTTASPIKWDATGHGSTPNQVDIGYFGFVKDMKPDEFRALVPAGNFDKNSIEFIKEAVAKGEAVAPPFLMAKWDDEGKQWLVQDHEGRSRTDAAKQLAPEHTIPIHILPTGYHRARHITEEMRNAPFVPQRTGKAKYEDDEAKRKPEIQKIPLSGRKYNPDWYLQPRRRGKWDTVALSREKEGHLSTYGNGSSSLDLSGLSRTDKRYIELGFGMSAENLSAFLHEALTDVIPVPSEVTVHANYFPSLQDNSMVHVLRMECKTTGLVNTLRVHRYLDNSAPKFEVAYVQLPYMAQAQGAGKKALKAYMDLTDHVGADKIELYANIDVGGYAWARYGFVPTPEDWKSLCVSIRKNMAKVDYASAEEAVKLPGHLKSLTAPGSDPRNIRAVAALKAPVKHPSLGETGLGWSLLRGTGWTSVAYMNDKETMAHLKATCAGEESFGSDDWERTAATVPVAYQGKSVSSDRGVFFMQGKSGRSDAAIHQAMLPAGAMVADQVAIRQFMKLGMSRADARRLVSSQRGYGG